MKKFTFKGVLDGLRGSVQAAPRGLEQEIQETLRPEHFQVKKVSVYRRCRADGRSGLRWGVSWSASRRVFMKLVRSRALRCCVNFAVTATSARTKTISTPPPPPLLHRYITTLR